MRELSQDRPLLLRRLDIAMLIGGIALLGVVILASPAVDTVHGESLTRNTIRLALAWYAVALYLMMRLDRQDWSATTTAGRLALGCWSWGLVCFLIHVGMAFHFYHHWSHVDAFERTRQISGLGEGIYFSYLFALVWVADALSWWLAPAKYAARSVWIDRALHAFMLFMVFNGMVVYESGPIRWAGIALFIFLPLIWVTSPSKKP